MTLDWDFYSFENEFGYWAWVPFDNVPYRYFSSRFLKTNSGLFAHDELDTYELLILFNVERLFY